MATTVGTREPSSQAVSYDCVLIDDDDLVRATWRMAAERAGKRLLALSCGEAFWPHAQHLSQSIPIYIDYRLQQELTGEQLAEQLFAAGFHNLYIETGYEVADIAATTKRRLKGVVGKRPPWR